MMSDELMLRENGGGENWSFASPLSAKDPDTIQRGEREIQARYYLYEENMRSKIYLDSDAVMGGK